jgi:hypothetical protein
MKPTLRFRLGAVLLGGASLLSGCEDRCQESRTFRQQTPFTVSMAELRQLGVDLQPGRALVNPGKIYVWGDYLFINEVKAGVHVIDNRNPSTPKPLAFLSIRGNADVAVKGNYLFADSYTDFLVFDISNPATPREVKRIENAFPSGMVEGINWYTDATWNGTTTNPPTRITDFNVSLKTEVYETDCDNGAVTSWWGRGWAAEDRSVQFSSANPTSSGASGSGKGGSMARFALTGNQLYAVTNSTMQLFDVSQPADPKKGKSVSLGWGIETIFPYRDKLFIGSTTGMHIYDNANPENPVRLSTFTHARACDPVIVEGDYAYVTLRSQGAVGRCGAAQSNQLDVVDVSSPANPRLAKTYPMQNPYGLGIESSRLYVCEGAYGLKSFRAQNPLNLEQTQHFKNLDAFDVIPLGTRLLVIGKDGLYQYDASQPNNLKLLSVLPVKRPSTT